MRSTHKKPLYFTLAFVVLFLFPTCLSSMTLYPYAGIKIYTPGEVLSGMTSDENGTLFLQKGGYRWELVTEVMDERIANKGDGRFFPMNTADVVNAVRGIRFPLDGINVEIFILPYPRVETQSSSATSCAIFLSPGVREYSNDLVEYTVAHEMGHIVQKQLMPETRKDLWARYKSLRQISDGAMYNENSDHDRRPREVFAEDFRMLFSNASGEGELPLNEQVESPQNVRGLKDFMLSLSGKDVEELSLQASPNPVIDGTTFVFDVRNARNVSVRIFDAKGSLVRTLIENEPGNRPGKVFWDGNDFRGRALSAGIYFARLSTPHSHRVERVLLVR